MRKKIVATLLVFSTFALIFSGCKKDKKNAEIVEEEIEEYEYEDDDYYDDYEEEIEEEYLEDYSIEDIADLNGVDVSELNAFFDENDVLIFLGDMYGEEKVTNEDEALKSLEHVTTLAGLEDVRLDFNRKDVSPVTGNTVYTFYQVSDTDVDGEMLTARFYNSLVKVVVDEDDNLAGLSSNIYYYDDISEVDPESVLSRDDAIAYVEYLCDGRRVYGEDALYAFWDDEGTVGEVNSQAKVCPAWFIHADADLEEGGGKPYVVYVVSLNLGLTINEEGEYENIPAVMAKFYTDTRDDDEYMGTYTSTFYFKDMKDAGTYTYDVDMKWVKDYFPEYAGDKTASYTVPVMYSEKEDLYYLGSLDNKVTLSNYYDFINLSTTNAYVTSTPEDKDSWHFQLDKAVDGSTGKYFDDPNYVLSSFSVMCDIWDSFYEVYGLDGVDGTGLPTMLLVYGVDGEKYPESLDEFEENAYNYGQNRDWQVMVTMPSYPGCLDHGTMGHEYTHGINSQLTKSQYLNGAGAVMEAYADIIGNLMGGLREYPECTGENMWSLSSVFTPEIRNMEDPTIHLNPKFIDGNYFINPVQPAVGEFLDNGGVHTNSGVLNYLAYCLCEGVEGDDDGTLTIDENLDLWLDTLYYTNYQTDYYDVAHYLLLAARSKGLPQDKQDFVRRTLVSFGLIMEDGVKERSLTEDSDEYILNVEYDDSVYDDLADAFPIGIIYGDEEQNGYYAGGIDWDGQNIYHVEPSVEFDYINILVGDSESEDLIDSFTLDVEAKPSKVQNIFYVFKPVAEGYEEATPVGWKYSGGSANMGDIIYEVDDEGAAYIEAMDSGNYFIVLRSDDSDEDEANYQVIHFFVAPEEFIRENFE